MWRVILTPEAEKGLKNLPINIQERVKDSLQELHQQPFSGKPLKGNLSGRFSKRIGDYRIIYRQQTKKHEIWIISIRHRKDVYR